MKASESARTGKLEMSRFHGLSPGNTEHEPMCGPSPGADVVVAPPPAPLGPPGSGIAPGPCPEPEPQPHRPNAARPASIHLAVRGGISALSPIPMAVQTAQSGREFSARGDLAGAAFRGHTGGGEQDLHASTSR